MPRGRSYRGGQSSSNVVLTPSSTTVPAGSFFSVSANVAKGTTGGPNIWSLVDPAGTAQFNNTGCLAPEVCGWYAPSMPGKYTVKWTMGTDTKTVDVNVVAATTTAAPTTTSTTTTTTRPTTTSTTTLAVVKSPLVALSDPNTIVFTPASGSSGPQIAVLDDNWTSAIVASSSVKKATPGFVVPGTGYKIYKNGVEVGTVDTARTDTRGTSPTFRVIFITLKPGSTLTSLAQGETSLSYSKPSAGGGRRRRTQRSQRRRGSRRH